MSKDTSKEKKHAFSIELDSSSCMKSISILNDSGGGVLIEGYLGELEEVGLIEGIMLEVKGVNGNLRLELNEGELRRALSAKAGHS